MDEYSRGYAEVEALRRILRAEVEASINHPEYQDPWDLNLDPLSDWFRRFLGPTLAPFAAEMTGEFASQLTRCAPKRFATCASLNSIFQVQDLSHSLTVLAAEAGRLSKNIINHGFTLSDFGDMNDVRKVLQDLTAERQIYQEAAEHQEVGMFVSLREFVDNLERRCLFDFADVNFPQGILCIALNSGVDDLLISVDL
ncbi:uncharacterized protein LOC133034225 [Cannabis sativa]|uniref:uncharacterized protein LOC133034225 n=1 Tax=Cannabis sativa TaxID=3483 RepID=UPI0029CA85AC|nr:uncharacterized protein LOC133034225 [Cannabis sativa]